MAATSNASSSTTPVLFRARDFAWYWNSSADGKDEQWQKYNDVENEIIEDAFKQKKSQVEIDGDYVITFKEQIHYKKNDSDRQYPIQRISFNKAEHLDQLREERLLMPVPITTCTSTVPNQTQHQNIDLAQMQQYGYFISAYFHLEVSGKNKTMANIVDDAVQGILHEGTTHGKVHEANWLAKKLHDVKHFGVKEMAESFNIPDDICRTCIYLYTKQSFWYKLLANINPQTILHAQLKTLGPFCYLFDRSLLMQEVHSTRAVYRGLDLTDEERKHFMKTWIKLNFFTSTSSKREVAEVFQANTLLIIELTDRRGASISHLSDFPKEEEFVLWPAMKLYFVKHEYDTTKSKHLIYLSYEVPPWIEFATDKSRRYSTGSTCYHCPGRQGI